MATRKKALARGLASLVSSDIQEQTSSEQGNQRTLKLSSIVADPEQPRKEFDQEKLAELATSLEEIGMIQPITVTENQEKPGQYLIVAGERRWRAAKLIKMDEVPVIIKDLNDQNRREIALVENIQRENLSILEEAYAYQELIKKFKIKQDQLAKRLGKSRSSISNTLRILKLPEEIIEMIGSEKISFGHAKAIMTVKETQAQINLAKKIVAEKLSVRATEDIVGRVVLIDNRKGISKNKTEKTNDFFEHAEALQKNLASKVSIKSRNNNAGKISIQFHSREELERIVEAICRN